MDDYWYGTAGYPTSEIRDQAFAAFAAQAGEYRDFLVAATTSQFPDVPAGLTSGVEVGGLPGFWWLYRMDRDWGQTDAWIAMADLPSVQAEAGDQQRGPWIE